MKWTGAGEVITFTYRVLDATKAEPLNDKRNEPSLIDPQAGVKQVIPSLEKVGQLRQSATPEVGKTYWMAFSNKGRLVKRGDHIKVVMGHFRADGVVVDEHWSGRASIRPKAETVIQRRKQGAALESWRAQRTV